MSDATLRYAPGRTARLMNTWALMAGRATVILAICWIPEATVLASAGEDAIQAVTGTRPWMIWTALMVIAAVNQWYTGKSRKLIYVVLINVLMLGAGIWGLAEIGTASSSFKKAEMLNAALTGGEIGNAAAADPVIGNTVLKALIVFNVSMALAIATLSIIIWEVKRKLPEGKLIVQAEALLTTAAITTWLSHTLGLNAVASGITSDGSASSALSDADASPITALTESVFAGRADWVWEILILSGILLVINLLLKEKKNLSGVIALALAAGGSIILVKPVGRLIQGIAAAAKPLFIRLMEWAAALFRWLLMGKPIKYSPEEGNAVSESGMQELAEKSTGNANVLRTIVIVIFLLLMAVLVVTLLKLFISWLRRIRVGGRYIESSFGHDPEESFFVRLYKLILYVLTVVRAYLRLASRRDSVEYRLVKLERKYRKNEELRRLKSDTPREFILRIAAYEAERTENNGKKENQQSLREFADEVDEYFYGQ